MEQQLARSPSAFAPPCQSCHEPGGRPRSVKVQAKQRTVSYVCDRCARTWEIDVSPENDGSPN
jgi:protein-arginine kinase activator protein McsA